MPFREQSTVTSPSESEERLPQVHKQSFLFIKTDSVLSVITKPVTDLDKYRGCFAENGYDKVPG